MREQGEGAGAGMTERKRSLGQGPDGRGRVWQTATRSSRLGTDREAARSPGRPDLEEPLSERLCNLDEDTQLSIGSHEEPWHPL